MDFSKIRREICEIYTLIYKRGLISGGDGNVSVRVSGTDRILVTPKGVHKGMLRPDELSLVALDGGHVSGPLPSSELVLHLEVYRKREDVNAIIHAHPPWTTALYVAGKAVDRPFILSEAEMVLGRVGVVPYLPPGSTALATHTSNVLEEAKVCVLLNHGAISCGKDLMEAFMLMESLENCAKITVFTHLLGGPQGMVSQPDSPSNS